MQTLAGCSGAHAGKTALARAFAGPVQLVLPPIIYAVPGIEANLYFDNVVLVTDRRQYAFDAICDKGLQFEERWAFTPAEKDVGEYPIEVAVRDERNAVIARARSVVRVVPREQSRPDPTTLLIVGDSLTERPGYPEHLLKLDEKNPSVHLKLIGCRGSNNTPATGELRHEGYSGWTAQAFVQFHGPLSRSGVFKRPETGSPFVYDDGPDGKPHLDFARYCKQFNDGKGPDAVTIFLGTNDVFTATDADIDRRTKNVLGYYDQLIATIHAARPDTQIGIVMTTPPTRSQDGFRNYIGKGRQTRWQYRRNQQALIQQMAARYTGREGEHLFLVPAYLNIDTERYFPTWNSPINARATTQLTRVNDGAHPADQGYAQIADTIYCWLKAVTPTK